MPSGEIPPHHIFNEFRDVIGKFTKVTYHQTASPLAAGSLFSSLLQRLPTLCIT